LAEKLNEVLQQENQITDAYHRHLQQNILLFFGLGLELAFNGG